MGMILLLRCGFRGLNSVGLILLDCLGVVLRVIVLVVVVDLFVGWVLWGGCLLIFVAWLEHGGFGWLCGFDGGWLVVGFICWLF